MVVAHEKMDLESAEQQEAESAEQQDGVEQVGRRGLLRSEVSLRSPVPLQCVLGGYQ